MSNPHRRTKGYYTHTRRTYLSGHAEFAGGFVTGGEGESGDGGRGGLRGLLGAVLRAGVDVGEDGEGRRADLVVAANVVVPERDLHVLGEGGLRRVDEQLLVVEVWTGAAVVDSFATLLVLPELNDGIRIL